MKTNSKKFEEFVEPNNINYLILKINKMKKGQDIYSNSRSWWVVNYNRVKDIPYILCVKNCIVVAVYYQTGWYKVKNNRYEFTGESAKKEIENIFINKKLPSKYIRKGMANPVLYKK